MRIVSLAAAKAQLSELIHQAEQGEEILITRHGQPVVRLSPVEQPKRAVAPRASFREKLPSWSQDSASLIRAARDEAR
ncbi:MAG: type II toxin-antitoxin system Phd/YefM family antitoxin [Burkholderiales bacterium]